MEVDFTDFSSETPTGWSWDFGDTWTSTSQHPTHWYNLPGTYTVTLQASNANGSHTRVFPKLIAVPEPLALVQLVAGIAGLAGLQRIRGRKARLETAARQGANGVRRADPTVP